MLQVIIRHYHFIGFPLPCQHSIGRIYYLHNKVQKKGEQNLTGSTILRSAQTKGYTAKEFYAICSNAGIDCSLAYFYAYLADNAKAKPKQQEVRNIAVRVVTQLPEKDCTDISFSLRLKAAGVTLTSLHEVYQQRYKSDIKYKHFQRCVVTPYTTGEYAIAKRADELLAEMIEARKDKHDES